MPRLIPVRILFVLAIALLAWSCATSPVSNVELPDRVALEVYELGQLRWSQDVDDKSPFFRTFRDWFEDHPRGWTPDPNTYLPSIYLRWTGGAMNFLPGRNLVVIVLVGERGRGMQLSRPVDGETSLLWQTLVANESAQPR